MLRKNTVNGEYILKRSENKFFLCLELQEIGSWHKGELTGFKLGSVPYLDIKIKLAFSAETLLLHCVAVLLFLNQKGILTGR